MKRLLKNSILALFVFSIIFATSNVLAVENDKAIETKDIYECNQVVTVDKNINGNMFVMGQDVKIKNSRVNGDIFVMGQNVEIESTNVSGNIFVMGQKVIIKNGTSVNSVYALGQSIITEENVNIFYAFRGAGENINISGNINELYLEGEKITLTKNSNIRGKFEYTSSKEAIIEDGAIIDKSLIKFEKEEIKNYEQTMGEIIAEKILSCLTAFVTIAVLSLIFIFWDKNYGNFVKSNSVWGNIWKSFLIGLATFIAVPITFVILATTVVGIKLAFIALMVFTVICFFATTSSVVMISNMIFNETSKSKLYWKTVLIALCFVLITLIPVIGGLTAFILTTVGIGNAFRRFFFNNKSESNNSKILTNNTTVSKPIETKDVSKKTTSKKTSVKKSTTKRKK